MSESPHICERCEQPCTVTHYVTFSELGKTILVCHPCGLEAESLAGDQLDVCQIARTN